MELFVVTGPDSGRSFPLGPESVVGRDPTAAVQLTDAEVSRRHAIISAGEGLPLVEDLGSSNGTFVDDEQISGEVSLEPGQRIKVGQTVLELREGAKSGDPENLPPTKVPLPELGEPPENP
jgi:pSer/pThr/pTyr-binding forkhead associated (FHA) protein